jgi:hypothetical protein
LRRSLASHPTPSFLDEFEANPDDQFELVDLDEFLNGGLALPQSEDQQMDSPSEPETIEYQIIE